MFETPRASKRRKISQPVEDIAEPRKDATDYSQSGNRRSTRSKQADLPRTLQNGSIPRTPKHILSSQGQRAESGAAAPTTRSRGKSPVSGLKSSGVGSGSSKRRLVKEQVPQEKQEIPDASAVGGHAEISRSTRRSARSRPPAANEESNAATNGDHLRTKPRKSRGSRRAQRRSDEAVDADGDSSMRSRSMDLQLEDGVIDGDHTQVSQHLVSSPTFTHIGTARTDEAADQEINGHEEADVEEADIDEIFSGPQATPSAAARYKRRKRNRTDNMSNAEPLASGVDVQEKMHETPQHSEDSTDDVPLRDLASVRSKALQDMAASALADDNAPSLKILRNIALSKLTRRRPIPLQNLTTERQKVHSLVNATITAGEGNSMLILGARGTGKSALVNDVLTSLSADPALLDSFHVIRLDGFIHTDDKIALREIWRQLGREMDLDDDGEGNAPAGKNYADALSTLLALLSHPSEQLPQYPDQPQHNHDTSNQTDPLTTDPKPDDNDTAHKTLTTRSIIFVITSFEHFAAHPRQTLLYNLFDIAQARKAPIAVLGLSTRMDVAEMLEKRVKSRFSHRFVFVPQAKSLASFLGTLEKAVGVEVGELSFEERSEISRVGDLAGWCRAWNAAARSLLESPGVRHTLTQIYHTLTQIYHTTKSIPDALVALYLPVFRLSPSTSLPSQHPDPDSTTNPTANSQPPQPTPSTTKASPISHPPLQPPPLSPLHILPTLSPLSLALLISALRIPHLTGGAATTNFHTTYAEYARLASAARLSASLHASAVGGVSGRVWGRGVARGVWEGLLGCGLLVGITGKGTGETEMVRAEVGIEEVEGAFGAGMDPVLVRWCREL